MSGVVKTPLRALTPLLPLGLMATPIYLYASGLPQLSHVLLAFGSIGVIATFGCVPKAIELFGCALLAYMVGRAGIAYMVTYDLLDILPAVYFGFNLAIMVGLISAVGQSRQIGRIKLGISIAALIALVGVIVIGARVSLDGTGERAIGTFNNPNQLGYFAVCIGAIAVTFRVCGLIGGRLFICALGASALLAAESLSKAAMIAVLLLVLVAGSALSRESVRQTLYTTLFAISAAVALYVAVMSGVLSEFDFFARLSGIGSQSDDNMEARGYLIMADATDMQWVFGYGGSAVRDLLGHEVHSTVFAFLAEFGLIGLLGFLAFLALWIRSIVSAFGWWAMVAICGPVLTYGLAHNGSRFSMFWVLIGLSVGLARRVNDQVLMASAKTVGGRRREVSLGVE